MRMHRLVECVTWILASLLSAPAFGQDVPVPESIRAEGVPAVASSLQAKLSRYQNIRAAGFQGWDDTHGRAMYVTTRFADTPQVHHIAGAGGLAAAAHLPRRARAGRHGPAPARPVPLFDRRGGGRELSALPPGSSRRRGAADHRRQEPEHFARWSHVGRAPGLEQQRPQRPRHGPLRRRARRPALPAAAQGGLRAAGPSPTGRPTNRGRRRRVHLDQRVVLHVIDVATGEAKTITPRADRPQGRPVAYGDAAMVQGRQVDLLHSPTADSRVPPPGPVRPGSREADDRRSRRAIPWDVEEFDLSRRRLLDRRSWPTRTAIDAAPRPPAPRPARSSPAPSCPPGQISGLAFRQGLARDRASHSQLRARSPPTPIRYDLGPARTKLERWTESETGGLDHGDVPRARA